MKYWAEAQHRLNADSTSLRSYRLRMTLTWRCVSARNKCSNVKTSRLKYFKSFIKIKINLKFYFHTSLWCLKRFYECLYGLQRKLLWQRKEVWKEKFQLFFSFRSGLGRESNFKYLPYFLISQRMQGQWRKVRQTVWKASEEWRPWPVIDISIW